MPFLGFTSPFKGLRPAAAAAKVDDDGDDDERATRSDADTKDTKKGDDDCKPVRLVEYVDAEEGGRPRFEVNAEALDALRRAEGDVAVVSCCGRSRQGKSFLLNVLLRRVFELEDGEPFAGFRTSGSTEPCTKGLYLWPEPLTGTKDGRKLSVFFVDSEGIDSHDQTSSYSAEIFSMAVLLSSVFVYNSVGAIDESALDKLSMVCELTRLIEDASDNRSDAMPSLVWLLRDFFLDFGDESSASDYLEKALRNSPGAEASTSAQEQRNFIRDTIRGLFPQRECLALVRPHANERTLRNLDSLPVSSLRTEFMDGVESLYQSILNQVRPKRFGDRRLDGEMMAAMVEGYVTAINDGAVPTIASAWQGVAEAQCLKASQSATEAFNASLSTARVAASEPEMCGLRAKLLEQALAIFDKASAGPHGMRSQHREALVSSLGQVFETFKARIYLEAEMRCVQRIKTAEARARAMVRGSEGEENLRGFLVDFVEDYSAKEEGLSKYDLLCRFLVDCIEDLVSSRSVQDQMDRKEADFLKRQVAELNEKAARESNKRDAAMATLKEVLCAEKDHYHIMLKREQARNKRLTIKVNSLQQHLEATTNNVECTSSIVEMWAKEAKEAAKTPPSVASQSPAGDPIETMDSVSDLCSKFKSTAAIKDITNHS